MQKWILKEQVVLKGINLKERMVFEYNGKKNILEMFYHNPGLRGGIHSMIECREEEYDLTT